LSLFQSLSHRRLNPLTGEWVLVSPQRTTRPWQGQEETPSGTARPIYDPTCYLCPGNYRANAQRNPRYTGVFTFDNDFSALRPDAPVDSFDEGGLLVAQSEAGLCRVMCFSERHDLMLSRMAASEIVGVVDAWRREQQSLGALDLVNYVQIFENCGTMMGASNPHPHCQIWATRAIPNEVAKESKAQSDYMAKKGSCLLCDYLALEEGLDERVVCHNRHFTALVPFWATWPFETMVLPRRHIGAFEDLDDSESNALADILRRIAIRYDNLFETPFPYSMGFHQRPCDGRSHPAWHFHAHFYPPLLRSRTVRKFAVGFEMLASPQRDFTPEAAANKLRRSAETHYLDREAAQR